MLLVDIFELTKVIGGVERRSKVVTRPREIEPVAMLRGAVAEQVDVFAVGRFTRGYLPESPPRSR
jgi:hypothetical protein